MIKFQHFIQCFSLLLLFVICFGCKRGRPTRKILPDGLNSLQSTGDAMPFYTSDTTISGQSFLAVALPDPAYDSVNMDVVKVYEPIANTVFVMLETQNKKGVIIDLRSRISNRPKRKLISIQSLQSNNYSMDVIFLWDDNSIYRAAAFINELQQMSDLKCTVINSQAASNKQGCFDNNILGF